MDRHCPHDSCKMRLSISKKGGVIVRSRNIQADILDLLYDGKVHTYNEIASKIEVCKKTVFRHIQTLNYRYNIDTFHGGIDRGGVRLVLNQSISLEKLNSNDLQLIINELGSLQNPNPRIMSFIKSLCTLKSLKEKENAS